MEAKEQRRVGGGSQPGQVQICVASRNALAPCARACIFHNGAKSARSSCAGSQKPEMLQARPERRNTRHRKRLGASCLSSILRPTRMYAQSMCVMAQACAPHLHGLQARPPVLLAEVAHCHLEDVKRSKPALLLPGLGVHPQQRVRFGVRFGPKCGIPGRQGEGGSHQLLCVSFPGKAQANAGK